MATIFSRRWSAYVHSHRDATMCVTYSWWFFTAYVRKNHFSNNSRGVVPFSSRFLKRNWPLMRPWNIIAQEIAIIHGALAKGNRERIVFKLLPPKAFSLLRKYRSGKYCGQFLSNRDLVPFDKKGQYWFNSNAWTNGEKQTNIQENKRHQCTSFLLSVSNDPWTVLVYMHQTVTRTNFYRLYSHLPPAIVCNWMKFWIARQIESVETFK